MTITKKIKKTRLGKLSCYTLSNGIIEVVVTDYGAAIYQIKVKGKDITVHPENIDEFMQSTMYYGKTVGRTSGRLVLPGFRIDETFYPISSHGDEKSHLHGGKSGFSYRFFEEVEMTETEDHLQVTFRYVSKDGEEGYPGELTLDVTYILTKDQEIKVLYHATTTEDTLCNITNHVYFNLSPEDKTIHRHQIMIDADKYLKITPDMMIQGREEVDGKPFDLRSMDVIKDKLETMVASPFHGFDHTFLLNTDHDQMRVISGDGSLKMTVSTSYPALVFFTHNLISPHHLKAFNKHGLQSSFTTECQFEPGGIHHRYLHDAILRKDEVYDHHIVFTFDLT